MGGKLTGDVRRDRGLLLVTALKVMEYLAPESESWYIAGSIRRGLAKVGDVDLVVVPKEDRREVFDGILVHLFGKQTNGKPARTGVIDGVQVDISLTTKESWGSAMQHVTGSVNHNIRLRKAAKALGLKMNQYGVWRGEERVAGATEEDVYAAIGLEFVPPEERSE